MNVSHARELANQTIDLCHLSTSEGLLLLPMVLSASAGGATAGTGKGAMDLSHPSRAAKEGYCYQ